MKGSTGRKIFKLHQWAGLLGGVFILIMGISGAILVFHEELAELEHRQFRNIRNANAVSIDNALGTIARQYKGWDVRLQSFSEDPSKAFVFNLRQPQQRLTLFVHPSSGTIIKEVNTNSTLVTWILKLHYSLHADLAGEIVVLIVGLIYLISIATGLIVYRKAIIRTFLFKTKLRYKTPRPVLSALHRYVGVWSLILNFIVIATGLVISYEIVASRLSAVNKPLAVVESYPLPFSLDSVIAKVEASYPSFKPSYIRFPTKSEGKIIINGKDTSQSFIYSKYYNSVSVDRETGRVESVKLASKGVPSVQISSIARGIHFVEFGNLFIQLIFMLIGLSAPVLSITGFVLWKLKRSR